MKVLVIYNSPEMVGIPSGEAAQMSNEELKQFCFRTRSYETIEAAFWAYTETACEYSKLLGETEDVDAFVDEALQHIQDHDYTWLEENFT